VYTYSKYSNWMGSHFPMEHPRLYGMHPNTEIQTTTMTCTDVCSDLLFVASAMLGLPSSTSSSSSSSPANGAVLAQSLAARLPPDIHVEELTVRSLPMLEQGHPMAPYITVALQECTRMNALLRVMRTSLCDLTKGLSGQSSMTHAMEELLEALSMQHVPGRNRLHSCSWEKYVYIDRLSHRSLGSLFFIHKSCTGLPIHHKSPCPFGSAISWIELHFLRTGHLSK
jgi:dynein heavy chain